MKTLWRFGDSWACTQDDLYDHIEKNHSYYIAEHYDATCKHLGKGGLSNLEIFHRMLSYDSQYKPNDIILINFTFIHRIAFINQVNVKCLLVAEDYANCNKYKIYKTTSEDTLNLKYNPTLAGLLENDNYLILSNTIFFLIEEYITSLINRGVKVYHFFNHGEDSYNMKGEILLENKTIDYIKWCYSNDFVDLTPSGNLHYKLKSQQSIASKIIELIKYNDK